MLVLVVLLLLLLCQVVRGKVQAVNEAGGAAEASRLEAWTLSAALLSRVLHRLFQLNASYFEVRVRPEYCYSGLW